MNNLIHADIFFFITSVIVILFAIIGLVAAFYIVRILHSVRYIADKIKEESDNVSEDIAELREKIKDGGAKFGGIARTIAMFFLGKATSRRRRKSSSEDEE
jgi:hypothetical protein